ncbi:MAG: glucuronate isomerase [Spirochaetaceae bacterium]|nr:MAG: glucuronate isomerase [Spirochaetaceae bacterium]
MKQFLGYDFLLGSETARRLYAEHAEPMPIYDYHCHIPPDRIADNHQFANITEIWLAGDHYKWRAMRANGVPERLITGDAPDHQKFQAWAETVPCTIGNPLYHWTHLELRKPFGIFDALLDGSTAARVWEQTNTMLARPEFSTNGILRQMNVRFICTTDDPADDLEHHRAIAENPSISTRVVPGFRPDKALAIESPVAWRSYLERLGNAAGVSIDSLEDLKQALRQRIDYFHSLGSRISDHALTLPIARPHSESEIRSVFKRALGGTAPDCEAAEKFRTHMLLFLGSVYHELDWAFQLHIGALRNVNSRMLKVLGPDTGYDSMADGEVAAPLGRLLDMLDQTGRLPRTVLYNLNPRDNELIATMIGNFQDGSVPGRMQFGSGWWFNDQKDGMQRQMTVLANMGLLSRFIGMLTDSRSFLSYPRHEYFRRILCDLIGGWVENGEAPNDMTLLGRMVEDICWNNAVSYFGIEV